MGSGNVIQLNQASFWLLSLAAVALMAPLARVGQRTWLLAGLNLTFIAMLLRWQSIGLVAAIVVCYLLLHLIERQQSPVLITTATAVGVVGLFLLHKLPWFTGRLGLDVVSRVLSVIGYSYVALRMVEVFRAVFERRHAAPDLPSTVNYLLPFHMLAAGPIQAYDDFVKQPATPRAATATDILTGAERIAKGLFKKLVLAFMLQKLFLSDFRAGGAYFILELQIFFIWLYLDFSGYSDIAVGIGRLMGVATPENFNRPLSARNVIDFWERWHMSLSLFIRRNLLTPLQIFFMRRDGGRRPLLCVAGAISVSFLLCGLWHGLTVGFVIWGAAQAAALITVRLYANFLQRHLGKERLRAYLANAWIRAAANVLTFEFQAVVLLALFMG